MFFLNKNNIKFKKTYIVLMIDLAFSFLDFHPEKQKQKQTENVRLQYAFCTSLFIL